MALHLRALFATACLCLATWPALAAVSIRNANFFVGYTDYTTEGGLGLKIERVYNSKSVFTSAFGYGWGNDYEVYLTVDEDSSVTIYENGGGAENTFRPDKQTDNIHDVIERMTKAALSTGRFDSDREVEAYRRSLENKDTRHGEWLRLVKQGVLKAPHVPEGTVLVSNQYNHQELLRVRDGYERTRDDKTERFDLSGHLVRIRDRHGNFISLEYDQNIGRISVISDNLGHRLSFAYSEKGLVTSIVDERNRKATYEYDDRGDLIKATDVDNGTFAYEYNHRHNMTAIRYSDGTSMEMDYYPKEGNDNIKSVKQRDNSVTKYSYDTGADFYHVTEINIDESGEKYHESSYEFYYTKDINNGDWVSRQRISFDGDVTDTRYNRHGLPLEITRYGQTTSFVYDDANRVVRKTSSDEIKELAYDRVCGKVSGVTLRAGRATSSFLFKYDAKCNLVHARNDRQEVSLSHDEVGRVSSMSAQGGNLRFVYNSASKPIEIILDGVGKITVTYDDDNAIQKVESPDGRRIALQVTSMFQQLMDIIRPAGVSLSF